MSLKTSQIVRLVGIIALITLSAGMICYSACFVRYPVDGKPASEFVITQLSLTHCVERDGRGRLTNPYAESGGLPLQPESNIASASGSAVWAVVYKQDNAAQVADQPAKKTPKKPAPKKPAPKKPAPKKPAGKLKPKACPT